MPNTSPIYPGTIANTVNLFAPSTATTKTLATGSTNGSLVTAINYHQSAAAAMTLTLKTTIGGVTVTIATHTTAATAGLELNLLSATYIRSIDDANPVFTLRNGQTLELEVNSVASTVSVETKVGDF